MLLYFSKCAQSGHSFFAPTHPAVSTISKDFAGTSRLNRSKMTNGGSSLTANQIAAHCKTGYMVLKVPPSGGLTADTLDTFVDYANTDEIPKGFYKTDPQFCPEVDIAVCLTVNNLPFQAPR